MRMNALMPRDAERQRYASYILILRCRRKQHKHIQTLNNLHKRSKTNEFEKSLLVQKLLHVLMHLEFRNGISKNIYIYIYIFTSSSSPQDPIKLGTNVTNLNLSFTYVLTENGNVKIRTVNYKRSSLIRVKPHTDSRYHVNNLYSERFIIFRPNKMREENHNLCCVFFSKLCQISTISIF